MLIGVLSDTHLDNLTEGFMSLAEDRFSDCDMVVHAGDFTSPAVYCYLNKVTAGNLVAVYGNMDPPELRRLLPERIIFKKLGIKIGVTHGWGGPQDLEAKIVKLFQDDGVRCIIYGHSHSGVNHNVDNVLFFNPGSPTDKYHAKITSIGYISIRDNEISGEIVPI
ncbi:MAG: metallophosphoesterase [Desulfobacterales bacterium]|nr:metallophosphoesterase [Desulfobacterales bacterium]